MLIRILILLCLLPAGFLTSRANTFIVTSNADSGPGTLREAITLANGNGTASFDTILFSIADLSITGRTIILQSSLPNLTSRTIIDGTSQPGDVLGVSSAKIKLRHSGVNTFSQAIIIFNIDDIEIYGIYFYDFRHGDPNLSEIRCAIYVPGYNRNIKIGAAGKGNVFFDNGISIANRYYWGSNPGDRLIDATIQGNFFGLDEDGITSQSVGWAFVIRSFSNFTLGGNTVDEGNYFASGASGIIGYLTSDSATNNGFVKVLNNNFGSDFTKTIPVKCGALEISADNTGYNNVIADAVITVSKNTFNNPLIGFSNSCNGMLYISSISGFITVTGNIIGNLSNWMSCQTTGIGIFNCENGIIGGPNPADQNIITLNYGAGIAIANNRNMTIQRNSIYCNSLGILAVSNKVAIPEVKILYENGTNIVSGTAAPNCKIEVYQTPLCAGCDNGRIFMGETTSDNNGNWSFTGNYSSAVTATATTLAGVTGEFASPKFIASGTYQHPTCGQNNGSITGTQFISGTKFYWIRNNYSTIDTIYNQLDLVNLGPGLYEFVVEQTAYCNKNYRIALTDQSPSINEQNSFITQPSCGLNNGRIENIYAAGSYNKVYWLNENRDTVSRISTLNNAGPGDYKLIVMDTVYGCGDSTGIYSLINNAGPSLNTASLQINDATCGNANGSIVGISSSNVTGTPFIQWLDSLNNPVGSSFDLTNIAAGKYKLKFKDQSGCDTIITPFYTILGLGAITIDTSQLAITPSECAYASGTITGINVAGATSYQWVNAAGQPVSNSLVPGFVYPGSYVLIATNALGCEKRTDSIPIPTNPYMSFTTPLQAQLKPGSCDLLNGFVNLLNFPNPQNFTFRWVDSLQPNVVISTSMNLTNINSGTFKLFAKNAAGCEQLVMTAILPYFQPPVISESSISVTDEICSNQSGSIKGLKVKTGSGVAPFTYTWIDLNNNVISSLQDLSNIPAGSYSLVVKDGAGCFDTSNAIQVKNKFVQLNQPQYIDQYIKINTSTTLTVQNQQQGTYYLFDSPTATMALQQNNSGVFITPVLPADKTFYVQLIIGNCASNKTPVKVIVYDKTNVFVPSGFTPNNDGRNDILKVKAFGPVTLDYFRIYNRWGEIIFSTNDISRGWDGKLKGIPQPTSIFVWMIRAKDEITGEIFEKRGTVTLIK